MRLSKRMLGIIKWLNNQVWEDREKAREHLEKVSIILAQLGKYKPVNDEEINKLLKEQSSLSLHSIIIASEGLRDRESKFYDDKYGFVIAPNYAHSTYRAHVSLPEILANRLYPKGKSYRYFGTSEDCEGYLDAVYWAKSLQASYTRTMNILVKHGFIEKFHDEHNQKRIRYLITQKGKERLAILNKDRIDNTSHIEENPSNAIPFSPKVVSNE